MLFIYLVLCIEINIKIHFSPCLTSVGSRGEGFPERLSMALGCVHCERRDWGWGGSFIVKPTSMQFTFMFGFSPALRNDNRIYCSDVRSQGSVLFHHLKSTTTVTYTESSGCRRWGSTAALWSAGQEGLMPGGDM